MELDARTRRYFKYMQSGGQNAFARVIDALFFSILCFLLLFCLFWSLHIRLVQALVLAATLFFCALFLYFAYKKYKFEKFVSRELLRIKNNCRLEKLSFSSAETFFEICSAIFSHHVGGGGIPKDIGGAVFPRIQNILLRF